MKKYRDEIAEICHEIVEDGYRLGKVSDVEMKEFEADCFVSEPKTAHEAVNPPKPAHISVGNRGITGIYPPYKKQG